jgi:hypothetical protein
VYGKLASDLVAAISLTENDPVKSAVTGITRTISRRLPLFEIALVLVRFDHVARCIVNANHNAM